ncbi:MAG: polysaccharide pyruvyl transferase family protein, partial [Clostridia bacterium]|nr:polysaccharide pyruvyl transferase family protein [Clostridia bacterium]
ADTLDTYCFTNMDTDQVRAILANAKFTVGMRLHSLVFSTLEGVPAIGISYDSKIISFLEYIGVDMLVPCDNINLDSLINYADVILGSYEEFSRSVKARSVRMKREAVKNAEIAAELLDD